MPPLRKLGLAMNPTSWTVKDVCKVLKAVNLGEYMELFVEHRIQGDVLFSLTEENLREMGVPEAVVPDMATAAELDHCNATNPRPATKDDYIVLINEAMG